MTCENCGETVGRVRFVGEIGRWVCGGCGPKEVKAIKKADTGHFPFTTTNIRSDGKPVEVKSLRHLRKLENRHGIQSGAWN